MQALFFKFAKRTNSTKRPNDATGTPLNITIRQNYTNKEGDRTSRVCSPTFFITDINDNFDTSFNYMKYGGRYYFIRDIKRGYDKTAILECEVDALATLKTEILATRAYVAYSASNYNSNIDDSRDKDLVAAQHSTTSAAFPLSRGVCYILTVRGGNGLATTYGMDGATLQSIATQINQTFGESTTTSFQAAEAIWATTDPSKTDQENAKIIMEGWGEFFGLLGASLTDNYLEYLADVKNSIVSLKWVLIDSAAYTQGGTSELVQLGSFTTTIMARNITQLVNSSSASITVPVLGSGYMRGDRFSSYGLFLPYAGSFQLPAEEIIDANSLDIFLNIGLANGDIVYRVLNGNGKRICTASGNCSSDSFLATNNAQGAFVGSIQSAARTLITASSAMVSGGVGLAFAGPSLAESMIGAVHPQQLSGGGCISTAAGSFAGLNFEAYCTMRKHSGLMSSGAYQAIGGPLFDVVSLGNLSGYCKCIDASIESNDLAEIIYIANRQLNNGFFIEQFRI